MIFTYDRQLSSSSAIYTKHIVLFCREKLKNSPNEELRNKEVNLDAPLLIKSASLFEYVNSLGNEMKLLVSDGMPMISALDGPNIVKIDVLYNTIEKYLKTNNSTELPEGIRGTISSKIGPTLDGQLGEGITEQVIDQCIAHYKYLQVKFEDVINIGMADFDRDFYDETLEFCEINNSSKSNPFSEMTMADNVTLYQEKCTDELFIKIPTRYELLDEELDLLTFIPSRSSVVEPYKEKAAYTPYYKDPGAVPSFLYPAIEGIPSNNDVSVQDNEKRFYTALCDWIKFNATEEYGKEAIVDDNIILDVPTEEFLNELLCSIYGWHWSHNRNVPTYLPEKDSEDEDGNSAGGSDEVSSSYVHNYRDGESKIFEPAFDILKEFVKEAANVIGYRAYAEAIIKTARWGTRKPTCLQFKGYDAVFYYGTNEIRSYMGSIDDFELQTEDGCTCSLVATFREDSPISSVLKIGKIDKWSMPVGVVCDSKYVSKKDDKSIEVSTYYSFIDLIKLIIEDKLKVKGIEFNKTTNTFKVSSSDIENDITVTDLMNYYKRSSSEFLMDPFYRSDGMKNLYLQCHAYNGSSSAVVQNQFSLMQSRLKSPKIYNDIEKNTFKTTSELIDKMDQFLIVDKPTAIDVSIVGVLLPIFEKVQSNWRTEMTLEETFNVWLKAMIENNYSDESVFFDEMILKSKPIKELLGLQTMSAFDTEKSVADTTATATASTSAPVSTTTATTATSTEMSSPESVSAQFSFCRQVLPGASFCSIIDDTDEVIGGVCTNMRNYVSGGKTTAVQVYTLITKDYLDREVKKVSTQTNKSHEEVLKGMKKININGFYRILIHNLFLYENKNYAGINLFFADTDTMKHYKEMLTKKTKKG